MEETPSIEPRQDGKSDRHTAVGPYSVVVLPVVAGGGDQVAEAVAGEVEGEDEEDDGETGEERHPGRVAQVALAGADVGAPGGRRRLGAEVEETERRLVED